MGLVLHFGRPSFSQLSMTCFSKVNSAFEEYTGIQNETKEIIEAYLNVNNILLVENVLLKTIVQTRKFLFKPH